MNQSEAGSILLAHTSNGHIMPVLMSNVSHADVQTQFARIATPENPFRFKSGAVLDDVTVAYETWGQLNSGKNNAILLFHALSGSQHAAGVCRAVPGTGQRWSADCQEGWWDLFIGPGKALDTNKFFVICANYLGGCYGSSGPASINATTGKPYGADFPPVSTADVVRSQAALLDLLGITQVHAVIGASIGGLTAFSVSPVSRFPALGGTTPARLLTSSRASGDNTAVMFAAVSAGLRNVSTVCPN